MKRLILLLSITIIFVSCSSDNEPSIQNTTSLVFTEVMSFQVDTLELDMASNIVVNSFYITYSGDSGYNENVLKYNLTTSSQSDLTHPDISESRQIEIINDNIYSISSNDIYKFDLDLNNLVNISDSYNNMRYLRTTSLNNELLIIGGSDEIAKFDTNTEAYDFSLSDSPYGYRDQRDGEIYNNNIYMFGGANSTPQQWPEEDIINSFDEITIYNMSTDNWSQTQSLPYQVFESFTSLYNDSIIVTGNKNQDQTNSFIGRYDLLTDSYSEFDTSLDLENITIRGVTVLNDEIIIAYIDLVSPMPDLMTVKVVKASLI
ncbi:MAG TPA: hypothetical protein EYO76_08050 [Flavobacteriaceae bacterium]|nr:hypothetical protein [Flavobacteriaceae bacterium]